MGIIETRSRPRTPICCAMALLVLPIVTSSARAQQTQPPDAPAVPPSTANQNSETEGTPSSTNQEDAKPKNDRIFMIIPNYTTVEVQTTFSPLSAKEKFKLGAQDAFDPYSFLLAGILAGKAQAQNEDPSWGQGFKGYAKRYAAGFGDASIGSLMTTGLFPSILHEDPRYFRVGSGGFWHRSGLAARRLFVARTDSDHSRFNISEFAGNAAAAGVTLTYHSSEERTLSTFTNAWGTQIGIDFVANQLKEFWPDIRQKIFKR